MWLGFWRLDVPPSPNVQDQLVGLPVDVSVKPTASGVVPEVGDPWKLAVGAVTTGLRVITSCGSWLP